MKTVRVEVLGGTGTVCREGRLVVWMAAGFPPDAAVELLEAARAAEAGGAGDLFDALAASAEGPDAAFCVALESETGVAIVLQGHIVASEDGTERLRGSEGQRLPADLRFGSTLTVRGSNDPALVDRPGAIPFDLQEGAVPGGGFTLWALDRPTAAAETRAGEVVDASVEVEPAAVTEEPVASEQPASGARPSLEASVVLFDLSTPAPLRDPLPVASSLAPSGGTTGAALAETQASAPAAMDGAEAGTPAGVTEALPGEPEAQSHPAAAVSEHRQLVMGINCARGHFNNPHALYCGICGLAMVQNSAIVVEGVRPPLGVLLADDGTAYSLESDYILGRQPELAEDVVSGQARPLKVDDGTGKISRVHARVTLRDWDVLVSDLRSHNGTRVFNPGETTWRTLVPDEAVVLRPGGRVVLGQCTFEFQSIQRH